MLSKMVYILSISTLKEDVDREIHFHLISFCYVQKFLGNLIGNYKDIQGIIIGEEKYKLLSQYADDT